MFIVFTINIVIGQEINKETLVGEWTVIHVITSSNNLTKEEKQFFETIKKGFINSKFNFKPNGKFFLELKKGIPDFMKQFAIMNNKDWKFNEREKLISIGTRSDNYNHMRIYVRKQEGRIYFVFNDTPLILEMRKK